MTNTWSATGQDRFRFTRRDLTGAFAMVLCMAVSVVAAPGTVLKVVVAVLGVFAELGMLLGRRILAPDRAVFGVGLTIATGFAIILLAPQGLGEIPVLAGAAVLPLCVPDGPVRGAAVAVVAVGFGVAIMVISGSVVGLLAGVGAWFIADRTVEHAALQAERDRAVALLAELEANRLARLEAAAVEERGRIAREMHDVLAHSLAGLSVQLQAVRAVAAREGASPVLTEPLDRAAELARDGVQEARAAVGALRAGPLRSIDDLAALVSGFPGNAQLRVTGRPGRLAPEAGHAVYRAVQEALTNSARYATGSAVEVNVAWDAGEVRVAVRDHGLPAGRSPSGVQGSGSGLHGMTERIEQAGGSVSAGPASDAPGWRVTLRVPVAASGAPLAPARPESRTPAPDAEGGTEGDTSSDAANGRDDGGAGGADGKMGE
ncbi:Signal transduction histidine kinase [Actinacidiphila yanglinensis]|uniref:histidine kinase n=1 Tax=Actinacidiphila yanglinensis TaxID=310779 RepID=A0A1H6E604_9ACTN|nr:histidine kinase [Actinacidiphila yanglinensis]SEG92315.1 Signal transduction histidine kinase [Actinacidiphila yanglinensis]